uniref:Cytochrome b5 heme-binding domain-containing protein n=1 Tax=Anopheles farauti TaxID=69004 RepID=A0A182QJU7_9DIPT
MSSGAVVYFKHTVVAVFAILLFYLVAFRGQQILQYIIPENSLSTRLDGSTQNEERMFTEQELLAYDGKASDLLYLVIMGQVYDVTKGIKHYGPGESYHMFIAHDASRSFVTGEFEQYSEELSDVSGLKDTELQQLLTWLEFYDKTYRYVGKLIGRYFDAHGQETSYRQHVLERAAKAKDADQEDRKYPSCNVEWKVEMGTRVWCTTRSGTGHERGWAGRPRKVIEVDGDTRSVQFCACVPDEETGTDPQYVPFPGCNETADTCIIPDQN